MSSFMASQSILRSTLLPIIQPRFGIPLQNEKRMIQYCTLPENVETSVLPYSSMVTLDLGHIHTIDKSSMGQSSDMRPSQ